MVERFESESDSIRSSVADAIAAAEKPEGAAPVEQVSEAPKPEATEPPKVEPKAKEPSQPKAAKEPAAPAKTEIKAQDKPEALKAPENWSEPHKTAFSKLPDDGKKFLLERHQAMEADYTKKTQDLANQRKEYETIDKIFSPYEAAMKAQGFTKSSMVQAWANVEMALMDPAKRTDTLAQIIKSYKIAPAELAKLLGMTVQGAEQQKPKEVEPWEKELNGLKGWVQNEEQRRYQERAIHLNNEITKFREEKDKDGNLLHPHWDDAEPDMVRIVAVYQARGETPPSLSKLYEDAVWANPSTRQKLLDQQNAATEAKTLAAQQEADKKRREEARVQAEKAKRAGKSVTGSPGAGTSTARREPAKSLRDELRANLEEAEQASV